MDEARRRRLVAAGRAAFAVVVVAVLAVAAARSADELRDIDLEPAPLWLLAAAPFTFAGGLLLPLAWRQVLVAYGATLAPGRAVRVWCFSQASRFIPGNVALIASRVLLSAREGVSRSVAGASLGIEVVLILLWSALLSSWLPSSRLPGPLRLALALVAAGALVASPALLRRAGRALRRLPAPVHDGQLRRSVALYGVNTLSRSVGFVLVTASLQPMAFDDTWLVVGAVNAGVVLGMLGITPAGLGVREGIVTAALADRFGVGDAAALAVAFRAWEFLFELAWIGIAVVWARRSEVVLVAPQDRPGLVDEAGVAPGVVDDAEPGRPGLDPAR